MLKRYWPVLMYFSVKRLQLIVVPAWQTLRRPFGTKMRSYQLSRETYWDYFKPQWNA